MADDDGFSEDQKQYLEAFILGIAGRRGITGASPTASSAVANLYPADPMAIHYEAQDRAVASCGKLAAEEIAKRAKHPFDMWDEIAANAAAARFPKGLDIFRHKFHGLFYVAPNQDAFMLRLRLPGGILLAHQAEGLAEVCRALRRRLSRHHHARQPADPGDRRGTPDRRVDRGRRIGPDLARRRRRQYPQPDR